MNSLAGKLNNSMNLKMPNLRSRVHKYMKNIFVTTTSAFLPFFYPFPKQANAGLPSKIKIHNCCRQSPPGRSQLASTCQWWYKCFFLPQITDIMTRLSKNEFGPRLTWDTTISMACTSWVVWTLESFHTHMEQKEHQEWMAFDLGNQTCWVAFLGIVSYQECWFA